MRNVVTVRGPPNGDFVQGYCGIPATRPSIAGIVEIRPHSYSPLPHITHVSLALLRTDLIQMPSPGTGLSIHKKQETATVREALLYKCLYGNGEPLTSMDLPFNVVLPGGNELPPASLALSTRACETHYMLTAKIHEEKPGPYTLSSTVPVIICRFDTLSCFGMFGPTSASKSGTDHVVTVQLDLHRSAFGPGDLITGVLKIGGNPDWPSKMKKARLRKISYQVDEILQFNPAGDSQASRKYKIAERIYELNKGFDDGDQVHSFELSFPAVDRRDASGLLPRLDPGPFTGFTTKSTMYEISYNLAIVVKLTNAKDVMLEQRLTICPWDAEECKAALVGIERAVDTVRNMQTQRAQNHSASIANARREASREVRGPKRLEIM